MNPVASSVGTNRPPVLRRGAYGSIARLIPLTRHRWPAFVLLSALCLGGLHQASAQQREAAGRIKPPSGMSDRGEVVRPLAPSGNNLGSRASTFLPALPSEAIEFIKRQNEAEHDRRLQIGLGRKLDSPLELSTSTTTDNPWTSLTNGWRVMSFQIGAAGAVGLRVHFENISLPTGAQIVIYDLADLSAAPVVVDATALGPDHDLWSPTLFAEFAGIECQLPPGADPDKATFTINELSQIFRAPVRANNLKEGSCEVDVSCYPAFANEADAVAMISYVRSGNTYLCTGCLLAPTKTTPDEYFLTAGHCIGSQTLASTVEFYWLYQTRTCNGTPPLITSVPKTSGGGDLLGTGPSDFSLLRLRRPAPSGVRYLGWSVNRPADGEKLAGIHHPDGAFKRISLGTFDASDVYFWAVQWSVGVTEGGSSGSPLLNANHQVIGQLNGGFDGPGSSCGNPSAPDQYGRFDLTYQQIKQWIDPSGDSGGPAMLGGSYAGLFYDQSTGVVPGSSGSFTLTTTAKGKYSARIRIGGASYSFSGQLDVNGTADVRVNRHTAATLAINIQVNVDQGGDALTGLVSDGDWTATLSADRALASSHDVSGQMGHYTFVIPASAGGPAGDGYGMATVNKQGHLTLSGALADGTKISQSTFVAPNGQASLYVPLYRGQGYLFGWITFSDQGDSDLGGQVYWNKSVAGGFSIVPDLSGSIYNRPGIATSLLNFSDGTLSLAGGSLGQALQADVRLHPDGHVTNHSGLRLTAGFSPSTGMLSGSVVDPVTNRSIPFRGVAFQKRNLAEGYFISGGQAGELSLRP